MATDADNNSDDNSSTAQQQQHRKYPKKKKDKAKRRFAQEVHPQQQQQQKQKQQQPPPKMDDAMANFARMEAEQWKKKQKSKNKNGYNTDNDTDSSTMTVKDLMKKFAEEENIENSDKRNKNVKKTEFKEYSSAVLNGKKINMNGNKQQETPLKWTDAPSTTNYQQQKQRPYNSNSKKSTDPSKSMMRSNMSIDDLENVMLKRWGTNAKQWTAEPNEYDERDNNSNKDEGIFFRGKAVVDPWEEQVNKNNNINNQEIAEVKRDKKDKKVRTKNKKKSEFYDEDDEGFEFKKSKRRKNDYGDLVAPEPVGGSNGSMFSRQQQVAPPTRVTEKTTKSKRSSPATEDSKTKQTPTKPPRKRSAPKLDDNGNTMYLTLDRALEDAKMMNADTDEDGNAEEDTVEEIVTFPSLGITDPQLLKNLESLSMYTPLPVQTQAIPPALTGRDILLPTHTGSGKTLAFLLPIVQRILNNTDDKTRGVKAIILAPGRELASQIMAVTRETIQGTGLKAMMAIGGTPFQRTVTAIRKDKPDIVVATPGRLAELIVGQPGEKSGKLKLNSLTTLVLDEFDALLEYKPHREPTTATLDFIHSYMRSRNNYGDERQLQTFLCSATATDIPAATLNQYFLHPDKYATASTAVGADDKVVTASGMSKTVTHGVVHVPHQRLALETLRKVLHTEPAPEQILIFVENSRRVDIVVDKLAEMNIIAAPLHGGGGMGKSGGGANKNDRAEINKALRDGYVGIVVATELAARGIDAPLLTHVINLDLPTDASHYAHRAGRCGRGAGRPGVVINFTTTNKERKVPKNRFGDVLGVSMYTVEPRQGKMVILNEDKEEEVERI